MNLANIGHTGEATRQCTKNLILKVHTKKNPKSLACHNFDAGKVCNIYYKFIIIFLDIIIIIIIIIYWEDTRYWVKTTQTFHTNLTPRGT